MTKRRLRLIEYRLCQIVVLLLLVLGGQTLADGQVVPGGFQQLGGPLIFPGAQNRQALIPAPGAGLPGNSETENENVDASEAFPEGATLATNPDVEGVLEKAERYLQEGNYRTACRFWQAAMKQAGGTMYSEDGEFYYPLIRRIESKIASLPAEGLDVYRVAADAEAAGYLAEGQGGIQNRIVALQKVVDFAFLSSQGDDAALELATVYLDRFEAFSADALLRRIIESYPEPSVSMAEVWLKLAVARSIMGDREHALAALDSAKTLPDSSWNSDSFASGVEEMLNESETSSGQLTGNGANWTSSIGMGTGGLQPAPLSDGFFGSSLAAAWMYRQQLREWSVGPRDSHVQGTVLKNPLHVFAESQAETDEVEGEDETDSKPRMRRDSTRASIQREWENNDWQSASMPLVYDGKVVFKSQADLSVWSTDLETEPVMRSLWLNRYAPDPLTHQLLNQGRAMQANYPGASRLKFSNLETMQFFGDWLFQSMSIHNGIVFSVEGDQYDRDGRMPSIVLRNPGIWNAAPTRNRVSFLSAYELSTGKALWNKPFPLNLENDTEFADASILGPAVGYHDSIVVPVLAGGRFFLVALQTRTGKMIWKQSICDSPSISSPSTTMVQIAIAGNDIFMTCGCGVLARVDASTGQLRWLHRYRRSVEDTSSDGANQRVFGLNRDWMSKEISGWTHDLVVVWGPWVVMAASDSNELVGYERTTGKFVWQAPRESVLGCTVDQVLGIRDGILYATGSHGLLAYELEAQGRLYGSPQRFANYVTGRGLIVDDQVVLPMGDHLQLFDRKTLKPLRGVSVAMPDDAPVGSLVSDGQQLWSAAMGMLVALQRVPETETVPAEDGTEENKTDEENGSKQEANDDAVLR